MKEAFEKSLEWKSRQASTRSEKIFTFLGNFLQTLSAMLSELNSETTKVTHGRLPHPLSYNFHYNFIFTFFMLSATVVADADMCNMSQYLICKLSKNEVVSL